MYTGARTYPPYPYLVLGAPAATPRPDGCRLADHVDHPLHENCPAFDLSHFISLVKSSTIVAFQQRSHASFHAW